MNEFNIQYRKFIPGKQLKVHITKDDFNQCSVLSAFILNRFFKGNITFTLNEQNCDIELSNYNICKNVWSDFGKDIIKSHIIGADNELVDRLYTRILVSIITNIDEYKSLPLLEFTKLFKPTWVTYSSGENLANQAIESNFNYLIRVGELIIDMMIEQALAHEQGLEIVSELYNKAISKNSNILEIEDKIIPWEQFVPYLNRTNDTDKKIDFVIFKNNGLYEIHYINRSLNMPYACFPKGWCTLSQKHIAEMIGLKGIKKITTKTAFSATKKAAYALCDYTTNYKRNHIKT